MSFFSKIFVAALSQTIEAVGNIVAPLPDDEEENVDSSHPNGFQNRENIFTNSSDDDIISNKYEYMNDKDEEGNSHQPYPYEPNETRLGPRNQGSIDRVFHESNFPHHYDNSSENIDGYHDILGNSHSFRETQDIVSTTQTEDMSTIDLTSELAPIDSSFNTDMIDHDASKTSPFQIEESTSNQSADDYQIAELRNELTIERHQHQLLKSKMNLLLSEYNDYKSNTSKLCLQHEERIKNLGLQLETALKGYESQQRQLEEYSEWKISSQNNTEALTSTIEQLEKKIVLLSEELSKSKEVNGNLSSQIVNHENHDRASVSNYENLQYNFDLLSYKIADQNTAIDTMQNELNAANVEISRLRDELLDTNNRNETEKALLREANMSDKKMIDDLRNNLSENEKILMSIHSEKLTLMTEKDLVDRNLMTMSRNYESTLESYRQLQNKFQDLEASYATLQLQCVENIEKTKKEAVDQTKYLQLKIDDQSMLIERLEKQVSELTDNGSVDNRFETIISIKDEEILALTTQIKLLESQHKQSTRESNLGSQKLIGIFNHLKKILSDSGFTEVNSMNSENDIEENVGKCIRLIETLIIETNSALITATESSQRKTEEIERLRESLEDCRKQLDDVETRTASNNQSSSNIFQQEIISKDEIINQQSQNLLLLEQELKELQMNHSKLQLEYQSLTSLRIQDVEETEKIRFSLQNDTFNMQKELGQANESIHSLKAKVYKLENENKQYQTVINQLRTARKVNNQDLDTILSERDEYKRKTESLTNEIQRLSRIISQSTEDINKSQLIEKEYYQLQQNHQKLLQDYQYEQQEKLMYQKQSFDNERNYDLLKSDNLILQKDLQQKELELTNLYSTIIHFDKEKETYRKKLQNEYDSQYNQYKEKYENDMNQKERQWKHQLNQYEEKLKELSNHIENEQLLRRKTELEYYQDRKKMQQTLNDALKRLKNSQEDVVDRTLVSNLIVSYFQRRRSLDVLDLIGRVLNFTDEQKVIVGLKPPSINIVSSLYNTLIGAPPKPVDIDGDNLAELWVNFLLLETEKDPKAAHAMKSKKSPDSPKTNELHSISKVLPATPPRSDPSTASMHVSDDYLASPPDSDLSFMLEPQSPIFIKGMK